MSTEFDKSFMNGDPIDASHIQQIFKPVEDLESGAAWYREATNTGNAYKVDFSSDNEVSSYTPGLVVHFKAQADNTGAATLTVTGPSGDLSAVDLVKKGGHPLDADDISNGQVIAAIYTEDSDSTNPRFEVLGGLSSGGSLSSPVAIADGGTGADNAGDARTNLGAQAQDSALDEISTLSMAKGDIFVHNGSEITKISPGSNGQVLSADSTEATGLKWAVPGGGPEELNDLDDVEITTPTTGQVLRYDGDNFVNFDLATADIDGLQTTIDAKQDELTGVSDVPGLSAALTAKQDTSEKGQANGYASLDGTGKVPSSQLPAGGGGSIGIGQVAYGDTVGALTSDSSLTYDGSSLVYSGSGAAEFRGTGSGSTAIGNAATSSSLGVAIGLTAQAANNSCVAIGHEATSRANATNTPSIAMGYQAETGASTQWGIALGYQAKAGKSGSVHNDPIAIGRNAKASSLNTVNAAIAIGSSASCEATDSIALGHLASASGGGSIAMGRSTISTGPSGGPTVAVGYQAEASGQYSIAIGAYSITSSAQTMALGSFSTTSAPGGLSFGASAECTSPYGIAIGYQADALVGSGNIALGNYAQATPSGGRSMALGEVANCAHSNSIALGYGAATAQANELAIGGISAINTVSIGHGGSFASSTINTYTVQATPKAGTDRPGSHLALSAGRGTGSGIGGDLLFRTAPAGTSGTDSGTAATRLQITGSGEIGLFGVTPVARSTGWSVSNPSTRKSFDTSTITLSELAEVVGTLVDYLKSLGPLGA